MSFFEEMWSSLIAFVIVDALVVAVVFGSVLLFVYTVGRQGIMITYLAAAVAGLLAEQSATFAALPYLSALVETELKLFVFLVSFLLFMLVLWRNRFFDPYIIPSGIEKLFFALGLAGWLIAIVGSLLAVDTLMVSEPVRLAFFSPGARLGWLASPLLLFTVFRGKV